MTDTTGPRIFDCDWSVASTAGAIKAAGFSVVLRYYSVSDAHPTKILSKEELAALDHEGLAVAVVFENGSQADQFYDAQKKMDDVAAALSCAHDINQPPGTPIYFAVDFDIAYRRKKDANGQYYKVDKEWVLETSPVIQAANEDAIYAYFEYAQAQLALKGYKVGIYGCGRTADLVGGNVKGRAKVADYFWLSASVAFTGTNDFYNTGNWHLFQNKTEIPSDLIPASYTDKQGVVHQIDQGNRTIDTDVSNDRITDFGQWRKDGSRPPFPTADSKRVLDNRAFSRRKPVTVFTKPDPASVPVDRILYGRNARILGQPQGGLVGVSLDESANIRGYCRVGDLTGDLRKMPPWPGADV